MWFLHMDLTGGPLDTVLGDGNTAFVIEHGGARFE